MMTLRMVFLIVSLVLFLLAGFNVVAPRVNLTALGLAFWVMSQLAG